jgi:hypothetical protein
MAVCLGGQLIDGSWRKAPAIYRPYLLRITTNCESGFWSLVVHKKNRIVTINYWR